MRLHLFMRVKDGKFGRDIGSTAAGLNRMFADHTRAFTAAYPTSGIIPKGHWGFHLASQLLRDGYSIDCYVGERQNCILKQCAESVKNTQAFETSVLTRILGDRLAALSNVDFSGSPEQSKCLPYLGTSCWRGYCIIERINEVSWDAPRHRGCDLVRPHYLYDRWLRAAGFDVCNHM